MHITIPETDEVSIRLLCTVCATFICGEGSEDEQRVMGIAASLAEFVDSGSVELHSNFSEE